MGRRRTERNAGWAKETEEPSEERSFWARSARPVRRRARRTRKPRASPNSSGACAPPAGRYAQPRHSCPAARFQRYGNLCALGPEHPGPDLPKPGTPLYPDVAKKFESRRRRVCQPWSNGACTGPRRLAHAVRPWAGEHSARWSCGEPRQAEYGRGGRAMLRVERRFSPDVFATSGCMDNGSMDGSAQRIQVVSAAILGFPA